jgi:beta-N-acetylhexosaminidase
MTRFSNRADRAIPWNVATWSVAQKVAQCLMVGYEGTLQTLDETPMLKRLLDCGLGGVITFRRNYQDYAPEEAFRVVSMHHRLQSALPPEGPPLWLAVDQEGGQIERLPFWLFPTCLSPLAIGHAQDPQGTAGRNYEQLAQHLAWLGLNFNFVPTLDLNLNPDNPIIGVRAFGQDPQLASQLGQIAINQHLAVGVMPAIKHFPGHGNGSVDSHVALPELVWTETESGVFDEAIQAGAPVVLVSHGYYPALQSAEGYGPATASQNVIQGLLRQQYGFNGVVISDDMTMGAVIEHFKSPVEAALACVSAGVDMLVYQTANTAVLDVYDALVDAYSTGKLPIAHLDASVERILQAKARQGLMERPLLPAQETIEQAFAPETLALKSENLAYEGLCWLKRPAVPFKPTDNLLVLAPDRQAIHHYQGDLLYAPSIQQAFEAAGFQAVTVVNYTPKAPIESLKLPNASFDGVLWLTWNPHLDPSQGLLTVQLQQKYGQTPLWLASLGMHDVPLNGTYSAHIGLWSYRPATIARLPNWLLEQSCRWLQDLSNQVN